MRPAFDQRVYPNYRVRFPAREAVPCSRGAREHAPRPRASRLPLAPDHGAVDDHRVDAFRALNRLREARRFVDFIFIEDRKSTRLNSSHVSISYAVFCLKKKMKINNIRNVMV